MKTKKGFTLVELLGVIVLLGLIGLFVYPIIGKVINNNKQKLYDEQISELIDKVYEYSLTTDLGYEHNVEKKITFEDLKNSGLINTSEVKNPITGKNLSGCMIYKWMDTRNKYSVRYSEECITKNPEQIELSTTFTSTSTATENGWYTKDFYLDININGASNYEWCGTQKSTCTPTSMVNSNSGKVLINNDGNNVICIIAYDIDENYTEKVCSEIYKLDKTKPEFTGITNLTIRRGESIDLKEGITVKDIGSGLASEYTVSPETIDTTKTGIQTITYTAKDLAGNINEINRIITVEGNVPQLVFNPTTNPNTNGWYNESFNVEINATDDSGYGISSTSWCETIGDSCTPNTNGTVATITRESSNVKVCAETMDKSGNSSGIVCSEPYKVDKTNPYFNGIADTTIQKGDNFNVRNDVTVGDSLSQVDGDFSVSPTSIDTSKAGTTILTYTVTDKAGNTKEITRTIIVDALGPKIDFEVTTSPNSNGWYNSTFFVNIDITDNSGTGIKETKWCGTLENTCIPETDGEIAQVSLEGSSTRICAKTLDNNGKSSGVVCSESYKLDTTKPTTPTITGGSTSYVTSSTISISTYSTELLSGPVTYEYYVTSSSTLPTINTTATGTFTVPITYDTNRAGDYIYVRAIDQAGNIGDWSQAQRLYIDINDPTITAKASNYEVISETSNVISSTYFNISQNGNASISSTTCTSNIDGNVTNTSSLSINTHTITCTVTKSTGKSKSASTTIKVKPNTITIADLKNKAVTSGDGLYKDSDGVYRFKGTSPANYIMLGTETYRILAIEDQGVKVVRDKNVTSMAFDGDYVKVISCTSTTCPRNNSNNTYCQASSTNYIGCNIWAKTSEMLVNGSAVSTITTTHSSGTVTTTSMAYQYLHNTYYSNLSSVQNYVVTNAKWNVGEVKSYDKNVTGVIPPTPYDGVEAGEKKWTWTGKIGLLTVSEYVKAQIPNTDTYNSCLADFNNNADCRTNNWLETGEQYWLITPEAQDQWGWRIAYGIASGNVFNSYGIRPVVYLKNTITLSGTGVEGDEYKIAS